jgi:hypothetical protein
MIDSTDFTDQFAWKLAAAEAEYSELLITATTAREDLRAAQDAAFAAQQRFGNFVAQFNRATKDGGGTSSRALEDLLLAEETRRNTADAAATRAKHNMANLEYRLDCLRTDVLQLRRAIDPPKVIQLEVAPRSRGPEVEVEDFILPPGGQAA